MLSRGGAPPGITAWAREEGSRLDVLDAEICGAGDTPYEGGVFRLEVNIPSEYPLKPPRVRFVTKIYHPNIDSQGRICLDSLNMPPKGAWKPSLNVRTLLTSIQALMSSPNADDGLMADITEEFRRNPGLFVKRAKDWTKRYACGGNYGNDDDQVVEGGIEENDGDGPGGEETGRKQKLSAEVDGVTGSKDEIAVVADEDVVEVAAEPEASDRPKSGNRLKKRARLR